MAHWLRHRLAGQGHPVAHPSQIAHVARTSIDRKWRAPDPRLRRRYRRSRRDRLPGAWKSLTARFGLEWVPLA